MTKLQDTKNMQGLSDCLFHNTDGGPAKFPTVKHQFHEVILSGTVLPFSFATAVYLPVRTGRVVAS